MDALDELVDGGERDACAAPDVHDLELAGVREVVHGGAPDAKNEIIREAIRSSLERA